VSAVMPGYAGGKTENPTYEQVCGGATGHAEVIRIEFDPAKIAYNDLLTVFFATHNPTTPNQQGADIGTQYRSAIFYTTEAQKKDAEAFIAKLNEGDGPKAVTEVSPLNAFYPAEEYHRKYYQNNSSAPYCQVVINPKLEKVREKFNQLLKESEEK
jgi:peptide-methionine (S)-S-oxide reductase